MSKVVHDLDSTVIACLMAGGVCVLRTDTLYGIVARAADEAAVQRVYHLKDRDEAKSPIVLIADVAQLFDPLPPAYLPLLADGWPSKTSIIIPSIHAPKWIRRENDSVAYRMPATAALRELLAITGPLIAPSANPEAHVPAMSYDEAYDYFGDAVDFYVDGGMVLDDTPSKLLALDEDGEVTRLR